MALDASQRREAMVRLAAALDKQGVVTVTKQDLIAAIGAWDDYLDANQIAINQALPQPVRGALTLDQKVALFKFVLDKRYGN